MNTEPQKEQSPDYTEINLQEVFWVLLHKIWLLFVCCAVGAAAAFSVTKLLIKPKYTASSMIYIFTKTTSITSLTDLQIGSQLTVDFQTLGTSRPVVERVISNLNLDTTYEDLLKTIEIENPTNTRILKINAENQDPQLAAEISNAMAESLSDRVAEVMSTSKPSTVEQATVPTKPSSPNTAQNTIIGGLLGLLIAAAVILIRYFMNDMIQTEEDVTKYLGLNVLAAIPMEHTDVSSKAKKKKNRRNSTHYAARRRI